MAKKKTTAEKNRKQAEYIRNRRASGTCGSCPNPVKPGSGSCGDCLRKRARNRNSEYGVLVSAGRCAYTPHCREPLDPGHRYCLTHLTYINRKSAAIRRQKRAEKWAGSGI